MFVLHYAAVASGSGLSGKYALILILRGQCLQADALPKQTFIIVVKSSNYEYVRAYTEKIKLRGKMNS